MIRSYIASDKPTLLNLIRANTPTYFDKVEETDFEKYLDNELEDYFVIEKNGNVIGCGGINYEPESKTAIISWDLIHPDFQHQSLGKKLLLYRINKIKERTTFDSIDSIIVRTSQFTNRYYEKFGFKLEEVVKSYWAKGIDLYFMKLKI